jgi:methylated-DNA-[protein]-cysteine S-methyltransferase
MIFMKKNKITISTGKYRELYFAVAWCEGIVISCSLGRKTEKNALEDVNIFVNKSEINEIPYVKFSSNETELLKNVGKLYYGKNTEFNPLEQDNKENFSFKVLQEVSKIPPGKVKTYKEIAEKINSKAYRAVGNALNKNPIPLIIPCHRVVRSDFSLGGFRGGFEMKKELLKREGVQIRGNKVIRD